MFTLNVVVCHMSCLTLCDTTEHRLLGSSVHGISIRILEWIAISLLPGDLPDLGIELRSPVAASRFYNTTELPGSPGKNTQYLFPIPY